MYMMMYESFRLNRQIMNSRILLAALASVALGLTGAQAANLFVANSFNNTIEEFNSSGVGTLFANTGLDDPTFLAFDTAGNLYAANAGNNTIEKFNSAGVGTVFASTGLDGPVGLVFDNSGNLYVANSINSTIEKFNSSGVGAAFATSGVSLGNPQGLAFDGVGNLYVSGGNNYVEKFSPTGAGTIYGLSPLSSPLGMAFDTAGNLYVANGENYISKFTPTGGPAGSKYINNSGLDGPAGLAFDNQGDLYVANGFNDTIEEFNSSGVGTVFANTGLSYPEGIAFQPAPEPSSWLLLTAGLIFISPVMRRRRAP